MEASLVKAFEIHRFDVRHKEDFKGQANLASLGDVSIGFCAYGAPTFVEFPEVNSAKWQLAVRGSGRTTVGQVTSEVTERQPCVIAANRAAAVEFGKGYEQLIVRVASPALERSLGAILGARPRGAVEFDRALSLENPHAQNLRELVMFVAGLVNHSGASTVPPLMLSQLQEAITVGFLYANRHSFSDQLERDQKAAGQHYVDVLEFYIEAHWDEPISVAKLSEIANHSARAIFRAFKRHRGYSPMAFAKDVRLRRARRMLSEAELLTSVTGVAFACGFHNLGHFADDYRKLFGELPSATLKCAAKVSE